MDHNRKYKLFTSLVLILLIANAISIGMFWVVNKKQTKPGTKFDGTPATFMIIKLNFDEEQQEKLEILRVEHGYIIEPLHKQLRNERQILYNLLKQKTVSDSAKKTAIKNIAAITQQIDDVTFEHFRKIRAICTPEQQIKFDEIIEEVVSIINNPRPKKPKRESEPNRPTRNNDDDNRPPGPPQD